MITFLWLKGTKHMKKQYLLILSISIGVFASVMSSTMLSIAFPDIVDSFRISYSSLQIRNILFFAIFATGLPLFGRLADRVSPKSLMSIGLLLFCLSRFLSGFLHHWSLFLVFQSFQAVADSMIVPAQVVLIRKSFPQDKMGWAFGWFSGTLSAATLIGPALGGVILGYFHWETIFYLLSFMSLLSFLFVRWVVSDVQVSPNKGSLPYLSTISLLGFILSVQVEFLHTRFMTKIIAFFFVFCSLGVLVFSEKRKQQEKVIFPTGAWKNKIFIHSLFRVFLLYMVSNAVLLYAPSFMRDVYHMDPQIVGFILLMDSIIGVFFAGLAGKLADKAPHRTLFIGIMISIIGVLLLSISGMIRLPAIFMFGIIYLLLGMGGTVSMPALNTIAILSVPEKETGSYMGFFQMIQFGTGAFAAGLFSTLVEADHKAGTISANGFTDMTLICLVFYLIALLTLLKDRQRIKEKRMKPQQL
jgi:MFS family permease